MKSGARGETISEVEVLSIDPHGLWLMARGKEHFLAYDHFPWFRNATVASILNVQILHQDHLHWPDLDVDLSVDMLDHPEDYPLVFA